MTFSSLYRASSSENNIARRVVLEFFDTSLRHLFASKQCSALCQDKADYAGALLCYFVETFAELYDNQVTYNIHCLIHLLNDVKNHGPLDNFSAFPFENHMKFLKRQLRKPGAPLEQLKNRLLERQGMPSVKPHEVEQLQLCHPHISGPLPFECRPPQYRTVKLPSFTLNTNIKDNCCLLQDHVVIVSNIAFTKSGTTPCIIGREFLLKECFYTLPFDSTSIGIYMVSQMSSVKGWPLQGCTKLVKLPYHGKFVVFPIIHTV